MELSDSLSHAVSGLLREVVDGPPDAAYFLNRGDRGLLASLRRLSAEQASARPSATSSIAAHVRHLHYGLTLLNRWARGDNPFADADFAASWEHQRVSDAEWRELTDALERESRNWMEAVHARRDWDERSLSETIGSIVHLAYHLGAIRQIDATAAGPRATG